VPSRAVRDALEIIGTTGFLVERNAGLVRGFEFDVVADRGEGCARGETQEKG
jgi:hypothetical protein